MYTGGNAVEIKTEADSDDMTECLHDDWTTTGSFGFFLSLFLHIRLLCTLSFIVCVACIYAHVSKNCAFLFLS